MPKGPWKGESSSSVAFSVGPRDSRVDSIYEAYLYDPKDLESSDPRRRELARKASQLKLHGKPANNIEANGMRPQPAPMAPPQQRKSIAFSQNTKPLDGRTAAAASGMRGQNTTTTSRDSGAFGLGLGMLGGGDSDSDSDSDEEQAPVKVASPGLGRLQKASAPHRPESWTDRAVAVGQRPPDSASQNPPSLKLMALKSAKQGGNISPSRPSQLEIKQGPVDRTSRHGDTIGFGGPASYPAEKQELSARHISARVALTEQLGLVSPNKSPTRQDNASEGYFDSKPPQNPPAARQIVIPPPIDVQRAQGQPPSYSDSPNGRPYPSPMGSARSYGSTTPNSATPLRSAGQNVTMPPNVLQRGPASPYGHPTLPHPAALRAGPHSAPPNRAMPLPGRQIGPPGRGPPASAAAVGPSFSDSQGQQKRRSLFRRSMAYLGGQSSGGPGAGARPGPQGRPAQRQSLFRRSMALLYNNNGNQASRQGPPPPPLVSPLPRVQGLQEDYEKPDHPRKSQFLGAGGAGNEWDTHGEGAKFWKRFSTAQKTAHMPKLEEGSKAWLSASAKGKRKLIVLSTLALLILVGVIVGAIVWREIVSPSGKVSDMPKSSYHANLIAKTNSTDNTAPTTIQTSVHRRSPAEDIIAAVHVHSDTNSAGRRSHKMRKRHFGRPAPHPLSIN